MRDVYFEKPLFTWIFAEMLVNVRWTRNDIDAFLCACLPKAVVRLVPDLTTELIATCQTPYTPPEGRMRTMLEACPSFHRIYAYCARRDIWPQQNHQMSDMWPISPFADLGLPELTTPVALADWLKISREQLDYFADLSGRVEASRKSRVNHYFYQLKLKKSGGYRLIEAPKPHLKGLQRLILNDILNNIPVHSDAFGFTKGKNCLEAAARHAGEQVVVGMDLSNFFTSITAARVHAIFRCLGYPYEVAKYLTGLTTNQTPSQVLDEVDPRMRQTFRTPHLPQGAPTSPSLANHAAFSLDRRLSGLARRFDMAYSRYADDLTFSGDRGREQILLKATLQITKEEEFSLNHRKTRIMFAGVPQRVNGIIVNRHLNIARKEYDLLKAILHACAKPDDVRLSDPSFLTHIDGKITWVENVNPPRGAKLRVRLNSACSRQNKS